MKALLVSKLPPSPSLLLKSMDIDDPNPSSSSTEGSLKRKERDEDEEEQLPVEEKEKGEEGGKEQMTLSELTTVVEAAAAAPPVKKKAKKALVKKVAVWKDIKKWTEGDDPLGTFPIEVLDMVSFLFPSSSPTSALHLLFLGHLEAQSLTFLHSYLPSDHLHRL